MPPPPGQTPLPPPPLRQELQRGRSSSRGSKVYWDRSAKSEQDTYQLERSHANWTDRSGDHNNHYQGQQRVEYFLIEVLVGLKNLLNLYLRNNGCNKHAEATHDIVL